MNGRFGIHSGQCGMRLRVFFIRHEQRAEAYMGLALLWLRNEKRTSSFAMAMRKEHQIGCSVRQQGRHTLGYR